MSELADYLSGKRIGISLSGGGARGAAHIGMLRALLEEEIHPTHVVGVSAGAIIGALYTAGKQPDELMEFASQSSVIRLIKLGIPTKGLTTLDYLRERLAAVLPENNFSCLDKPFYVGLTNLQTGHCELHNEGPLHDLVAGSCTIPFVFKPMEINGQLYVDGGVTSNMPVEPLLDAVDFIIGANLMPPTTLSKKELANVVSISWRCFDLGVMANTEISAQCCDLLLEPPAVADHSIFAFGKLNELHDIGYAYAKKRIAEWEPKMSEARF